jgi:cyclic pyranopterin phosphate synthase
MADDMKFLPKNEVLSLEELDRLCTSFIDMGVKKIRLSGGEPLVRRDILSLVDNLSRHLKSGALEELTLTTNGSQLGRFAQDLYNFGVRRVNVSIDTFDPEKFKTITRRGNLAKVLESIEIALAVGLKIKLNAVALKNVNDTEIDEMLKWCGKKGVDLTLIETMPLGEISQDRNDQYIPLSEIKTQLDKNWTLSPSRHRTGGPARYFDIAETGQKLGLITPLSHNFCESCNRVRVTCTGQMFMCLGQDDMADLRTPLRENEDNLALISAIREAITRKPKGHDFVINRDANAPAVKRHMSVTGG